MPTIGNNDSILSKLFHVLREEKQFAAIYQLLDLKTVDTQSAYERSCSEMTADDYRDTMEYFYLKNQVDSLKKILSPDCVLSIPSSIWNDPINVTSIVDLPINLLSFKDRTNSLRYNSSFQIFLRTLASAIKTQSIYTNWENIFRRPHSSRTNIFDISAVFKQPIINRLGITCSEVFYYLNPSMISISLSSGKDLKWLTSEVLPASPIPFPHNISQIKYVKSAYLNSLTSILFRFISALSFYKTLNELVPGRRKSDDTHQSSLQATINSIDACYVSAQSILALEPSCPPVVKILESIVLLYQVFFKEQFIERLRVKDLYMYICNKFDRYAPKSIQGDWMLNIFYLFWKKRLHFLNENSISKSLSIFFSRLPTLMSIKNAFDSFNIGISCSLGNFKTAHDGLRLFASKIPAIYIHELYQNHPYILLTIKETLPLDLRIHSRLRFANYKLTIYDSRYHLEYSFNDFPPEIHNPNQKDVLDYNKLVMNSFVNTLSALNRNNYQTSLIRPYAPFKYVTENYLRKVTIRECLRHFFASILKIEEFRVIISNHASQPIILITPLISKPVANIFGQALALSSILKVKLPFRIYEGQLRVIYGFENPSSFILESIRSYCLKDSHFHALRNGQILFKKQENPKRYQLLQDIKSYFGSFYTWASLFNKPDPSKEEKYKLIDEAFQEICDEILHGFESTYFSCGFLMDEFLSIIYSLYV